MTFVDHKLQINENWYTIVMTQLQQLYPIL